MEKQRLVQRPATAALIFGAFLLIPQTPLAQGINAGLEPNAGKWRTWVLKSGDQFRLPAPPDEAQTRAELQDVQKLVASRTAEQTARAQWWQSLAPSYRWNQIAIDELLAAGANNNIASRRLAVLNIALADAMVAVWDSKYAHQRARPTIEVKATAGTSTPSYPDEHAAAATVASVVLASMFPNRADHYKQLAAEETDLRLLSGMVYPSDIKAGEKLGSEVARAILDDVRNDGTDKPWTGSVPAERGLWNGTNPIFPQAANWRPWLMKSPGEFRPPPPPAFDSPERAAELAAVKAVTRTPQMNGTAAFWEYAVGGARSYQFWNAQLGRLLLESGMGSNAPLAARDYALFHAAFYDAGVACWDAKYAYWTIRPFQLDPELRTVFPTPNHPSYPAAHACYSMTSALVLGRLFPGDAESMLALGRESGTSRIWAGIHYPGDVAAGQKIAEQIAQRAFERARDDGVNTSPMP